MFPNCTWLHKLNNICARSSVRLPSARHCPKLEDSAQVLPGSGSCSVVPLKQKGKKPFDELFLSTHLGLEVLRAGISERSCAKKSSGQTWRNPCHKQIELVHMNRPSANCSRLGASFCSHFKLPNCHLPPTQQKSRYLLQIWIRFAASNHWKPKHKKLFSHFAREETAREGHRGFSVADN